MEEMGELYFKNAYITRFESEVVSCTEGKKGLYEIVLKDTAFYPESGGQPADHGVLVCDGVTVNVVDAKRVNGEVVHITDGSLSIGSCVSGEINWERRFDHMQNHCGEHIVSGLIHQHFGYENVGFHMGEVLTLDFSGPLTEEDLLMIETEANEVIYKNVPVEILYPERSELDTIEYRSKKELTGKVRLVRIPDVDLCACCGTHVRNTGEIGLIQLLSLEKHKNGSRVTMLAGKRALLDVQKKQAAVHKISVALSAKPYEVDTAVERLKEAYVKSDFSKHEVVRRMLKKKAQEIEETKDTIVLFEEDIDRDDARLYAKDVLETGKCHTAAVFVLNSERPEDTAYVIVSDTLNLRDFAKEMNTALSGRGGGKEDMIQGTVSVSKEEIEKYFNS